MLVFTMAIVIFVSKLHSQSFLKNSKYYPSCHCHSWRLFSHSILHPFPTSLETLCTHRSGFFQEYVRITLSLKLLHPSDSVCSWELSSHRVILSRSGLLRETCFSPGFNNLIGHVGGPVWSSTAQVRFAGKIDKKRPQSEQVTPKN